MKPSARSWTASTILWAVALLAACGGGSGSAPSGQPPGQAVPPGTGADPVVATYAVEGVLSGLGVGKSLVLALVNAQGTPLHTATLGASGEYRSVPVPAGTGYRLRIESQPVGQTCAIVNGEGTAGAGMAAVRVDCTDNRYTVGGTIAGTGAAVVLRNVANGELLVASDNGGFAFTLQVAHGGAYAVDVADSGAGQICTIANGQGTATGAVTQIAVQCATQVAQPPVPVLPPPPATPAGLSVTYAVKSYAFSWSASAATSWYELQEDPDGAGALPAAPIGGSLAATGYTHTFSLHRRLNAQYRVRACNAGGCSAYSPALAPDMAQAIGYFKASNTGANDQFGYTIALSADGLTLAVGARGEASFSPGINGNQADNTGTFTGAVYVFVRSGAAWVQQAYIKASNPDGDDHFGYAMSLSADGNTLAVGSFGEDSVSTGIGGNQADNTGGDTGAAYVFVRSAGTWTQQAYIKASNAQAGDNFGRAVTLSGDGNTLAVGAYQEDGGSAGINGNEADNSVSDSGAVYVFTRSGAAWSQQAYVKASNPDANDLFGRELALSHDGNTLVAAAYAERSSATGINGNQADNSLSNAGAVYVFTRSGAAWSQQAYLKASNTGADDTFGWRIALAGDGNTLAVAAYGEASNATGVNGNQADNSAAYAGAVYVFTRSGTTWSQQAYLKASNTEGNDYFGHGLAFSADGTTLAVGAPNEAGGGIGVGANQADNSLVFAGAVYVFSRSGTAWSQQAYVKASNPGSNDDFGWSVALSADGSTLAVGAYLESSAATGIGGNGADNSAIKAGAAYVY